VKEHASRPRQDVAWQLRQVLEQRRLRIVFQPIYRFAEGRFLGYEALVRGPEGSALHTPFELFGAAAEQGLVLELNIVCIQEVLRAFAQRRLPGSLFLNISPQLILQRGFSQERAERFLAAIDLPPRRVVIELTEDFPTFDFRLVEDSLLLYRAMGFRVAIDDLGEGFASLRLWSELRPEFVKADKHFVTGLARDAVKVQFLRAIQHIAENCGSLVIAEGIESLEDFRVVKDVGIACGQGWFIGRPAEEPGRDPTRATAAANADSRLPVIPMPRLQAGGALRAQDFLRTVEVLAPDALLAEALARFARSPRVAAIPVVGAEGVQGVVSRLRLERLEALGGDGPPGARPCVEACDASPIRVEGDLELAALVAILLESSAARFADGFVILSRGRYLGMGSSQDVMRALQDSQLVAARHTSPLTLLPGQVPINEHVERLLRAGVAFCAWYAEVDRMRGLNDGEGFRRGDQVIHAAARLLESVCEPGLDFVGHVSGSRFVVLLQSEDWRPRAERAVGGFAPLVAAHVSPETQARGYFVTRSRDGQETVRPLPRLVIGVLPVLPGLFESRHEVLACAKQASQEAMKRPAGGFFVDEAHANAYPASMLWGAPADRSAPPHEIRRFEPSAMLRFAPE
jgi:EAL domain-containing protein (putative c-di-GMP-specific phosphodiesterase class I)/GGDEF domain-containing protein